ncbi:MAG: FAD-dependent oxidoreductase [Clostridia bacterium]|nr:FAD-dependent oxidoreductase [Clostridia bacterium]
MEFAVRKNYDVVVVGGGVAGIAASVAAARQGASVLLLEKSVNLGGLATIGLISWYEPLCDGEGNQMMASIAEELIKLTAKYGFDSIPEQWGGEGPCNKERIRYTSRFSPTIFMLALDRYMEENGVEVLFDALATYPDMVGGRCMGVLVETVGGTEYYGAKYVIDATGTAVIMKRAGVPTVDGLNYMSYVAHGFNYEGAKKYVETQNIKAFRNWISSGSNLYGVGHPEGMPMVKGTTSADVTWFIKEGKRRMLEKLETTDRFSRDLMDLPTMPQYRKVCRIEGEYVFMGNEFDVKFEDAIGSFGDFRKAGPHFQLPYRSLYNKNFDNLLAAGRIISAEDEGWEVTRVIPVAALTGEAAGVAAALCCKSDCSVSELSVPLLQDALKKNGVIFR